MTTPKQVAIKMRKQGRSYNEIRKATGFGSWKLVEIFTKAGLTKHDKSTDPNWIDKVVKMRKEKMLLKEIAEKEGCSIETVRNALKRRGM